MTTTDKQSLEDLTEEITLSFNFAEGRVERKFLIREHSRAEQDAYFDIIERASKEVQKSAEQFGVGGRSPVEVLKSFMAICWRPLVPAVAYCLREPIDGKPAPTEEDIYTGLNERKAKAVLAIQDDLDGVTKIKKTLDQAKTSMASLQVQQSLSDSENSGQSTTSSPSDTESPSKRSLADIQRDRQRLSTSPPISDGGEKKPLEPKPKSPIGI